MPIINGLVIERVADLGIILEKNFLLEIVYKFLKNDKKCKKLKKILTPLWGQEIIYLDYNGFSCVILSAQGAAFAANAVERLKRTGVKCIFCIGTTGSTDMSITAGQYILPTAAVRNEGTTRGYVNIEVPAVSDLQIVLPLKKEFEKMKIFPLLGTIFTTDKRYRENPQLFKELFKCANVLCVDMETSAIFVTAMFYGISAAAIKIVTDCAVKDNKDNIVGVFEVADNYYSWIKPKILIAIQICLKTFSERRNYISNQKL